MLQLPNITLVAMTTSDHALTVMAAHQCLAQCQPQDIFILSDRKINFPYYLIPPFSGIMDYNYMAMIGLLNYIKTDYFIIFHWDGFIIHPESWNNDFLNFDYIGAPWTDGEVGNGGFTLRSRRFLESTCQLLRHHPHGDEIFSNPEDRVLCRSNIRHHLENTCGMRYAPTDIAQKFSFEHLYPPQLNSFGFHSFANFPRLMNDDQVLSVVSLLDERIFSRDDYLYMLYVAVDENRMALAQKLLHIGIAKNPEFEKLSCGLVEDIEIINRSGGNLSEKYHRFRKQVKLK